MTNPCASGVSEPKSGIAAAVVVDQQYLETILPAALSWLYPYLPWMHGLEIGNVAAFCAADPPTFTLPSAGDFYNFVTSTQIQQASAVSEFIENITKYYLWFTLCKCHTGSPSAPAAPPSEPSGLVAINPPDIVRLPSNSGTPCYVLSSVGLAIGTGNQQHVYSEFIPGDALRVEVTAHSVPTGANHPTVPFDLKWYTSGAATYPAGLLSTTTHTLVSGATITFTEDVPVGARSAEVITKPPSNSTDLFQFTGNVFCTPPLTAPAPTPCPPDPAVRQLLKQIYDLLTIVQRQAAPFAYVYGTNHTGLTGDGSITVFGLIGVSVDVTTLPDSYGRSDGTPEQLFDLGYVTLGSSDGYETSRRIDHDGTLVIPPSCGLFTVIGYTLAPGVAVSIRELVREP